MFTSIVVALDGSDPSKKALEAACTLAKTFGAELHLVHAPQIETMAVAVGYSVVTVPPSPEAIAEAGKAVVDEATKAVAAHEITPEIHTLPGEDPTDTILHIAKLHDADLNVLGRRG